MGLSPDRQQLLSLCLGSSEYACLIVRGYKTAETKMSAHLKKMCGRYVVLYAKQLPVMESLPGTCKGRDGVCQTRWHGVNTKISWCE
jgi:hypothetical protein